MNDLLSRKRLFQAGKANTSHLQLHQFSGARTENDKGRDAEFPRAIGRIAAGAGGAKKKQSFADSGLFDSLDGSL